MQTRKIAYAVSLLTALYGLLCLTVQAQSPKQPGNGPAAEVTRKAGPIGETTLRRGEVQWKTSQPYEMMVLTVALPDGEVLRREFEAEAPLSFKIVDDNGAPLPDGQYNYELRLIPKIAPEVKDALRAAREREEENSAETAREVRELKRRGELPAEPLVQSGSFRIEKGAIVFTTGLDAESNQRRNVTQQLRPLPEPQFDGRGGAFFAPAVARPMNAALPVGGIPVALFDQVIPDDLIVQGSTCVGFDCVNNESFGFDTIRLKENNLRIKFEDTSVGAFPTNDWQLTANDSASGGASKFSIEDITGARVPFTVTAGATTNSIFVDSTGRVGLRTGTPVLDLHISTSNTPSHRLEQNSSGGFTAQTWDVAGNEANFFVRDVTGGSRLPFRIRPGAPTSSIDVAASGNVGVGTASPTAPLHVGGGSSTQDEFVTVGPGTAPGTDGLNIAYGGAFLGTGGSFINAHSTTAADGKLHFLVNASTKVAILNNGNIGLGGVTNPTQNIQHSSGATLTGGVWTNASSRALKTDIRNLSTREAFSTLQRLNPVTFRYKANPEENYVGFIAEEVPELVATKDRKGLSPMDIVAVLTKAVQEQQQIITDLKLKVEKLEKAQARKTRRAKRR